MVKPGKKMEGIIQKLDTKYVIEIYMLIWKDLGSVISNIFFISLPCLQLIIVKLNILRNYPDITETNTRKNIKILILMILISFYVRER